MARPLDADDVLYSGSDDECYESPQERLRQYEIQAQRYMDGKPVVIFSAQLKGPFDRESGTTSQPHPINPWMDDDDWARVQAWRETVKPEYGSGEVPHVENKPLSPSVLGRKRPAVADFLRKALASSKRLKASELKYSTPATPSPVNRSLPIQQPDSSGTYGPAVPSSQDWTGASGIHGYTSTSPREAVNSSRGEHEELPVFKPPLVEHASSCNTVSGQSPTLVVPLQTRAELGTPVIPQETTQEELTSRTRGSSQSHLQPSFEQRLLSSHKVRLGTIFRRSSTAPVESRQGTPLRSPPANVSTPKHATKSSLPASGVGLVQTTTETADEQELEFESHADRSFQFRVKVARNGRRKDVSKQETQRSRLNRNYRASTDDRVPESPSPAEGGADQNSSEAPISLPSGNKVNRVSEDETASEVSLPQDRDAGETKSSRLAVETTTDQMEDGALLSAVELNPAAEESSNYRSAITEVSEVEVFKIKKENSPEGNFMEDVRTIVSVNGRLSSVPSPSMPKSDTGSQHETAVTPDKVVDDPNENEMMEKLPAHLPRNSDQRTSFKDTRPDADSSPYVADLGGQHMLPALALSFSPLSSFFGTRGDDVPITEVQVVEEAKEVANQEVPEVPHESARKARARLLPAASPIPVTTPAAQATCHNSVLTGPLNFRPSLESPQPPPRAHSGLRECEAETSEGGGPAAEGPHNEPNSADAMQADKQAGSSPPHLSSPQAVSELEKSIQETPHEQSPWTKDSIAAMEPTTAVDGGQIEPEKESHNTSTPADLNKALFPTPQTYNHRHLDEQHPVEGTVVPSVQSPWVDTILSPSLPTAQLIDDARFSSQHCHLPMIRPVQKSESQSQNPWRQDVNLTPAKMLVFSPSPTRDHDHSANAPLEHRNHISHAPHYFPDQLSSPISAHGSLLSGPKQLNVNEDIPMSDITSSAAHRPSTPSRLQSSLPTPDFTLSVKSFREFATPSPARRRMRPPGGHQTKSILKSARIRYSDMTFPSHMKGKPPPKAKRVSFASELARSPSSSSFADETTTLGVELPTMEATRTPPRRNPERSFSPPLQLSQSELPGSTDRFYSHFAKMVRKGPQMRRKSRSPLRTGRSKLLPSASQQVLGSPGFVDMAEAFIAADSMRPDPEGDDVDMHEPGDQGEEEHQVNVGRLDGEAGQEEVEEEDEDQYETDPVAHVLGNLDAFIGAFDVDLELSKARLVEEPTQENDSRQVFFPGISSQDLDREVTGRGVWG
ncbi:hypothetical protein DL546_006078 [Coniochaeta pulveracea]|uniref:Protamine P1 n=1 Tax=Coniochaeta pulveracea TaxID=177199 RepID=A0A420Y7W0_9PEZI|nr:hypothetical protein DL546_006078 [Coniochaeta pulveracea]